MTIANKILLYFAMLTLLVLSLAGVLWAMYRNAQVLAEREQLRFHSHQLADELRQSSDDLTRMARSYVNTGDAKYKQHFDDILAIRDGVLPRPRNYPGIFWDFVTGDPGFKAEPGRKISLLQMMKNLHFSPQEFAYLAQAKTLSDQLTDMEYQAFQAMKGFFKDKQGLYTLWKVPDPELARRLLYSRAYHRAKAGIMAKIAQFETHLDARTKAAVQGKEDKQHALTISAILLAILLIAVSLFGYGYFKEGIITPLARIQGWIRQVENNQYDLAPAPGRRDEIGRIARSFAHMAQKVAYQMDQLAKSSLTDPLTGLNNRKGLNEHLELMKYNHQRYGTPCAVIMFDLDHFKRINDQYGHLAGDQVLMEVAEILRQHLRQSDIAGRWGGDEFLIICPNTTYRGGKMVAEYLRTTVQEHSFAELGRRTASLGVSALDSELSAEEAVKRADDALYQAKSGGRNRVC